MSMYAKGELERAIDHYQRALRGDPDHGPSRVVLKASRFHDAHITQKPLLPSLS